MADKNGRDRGQTRLHRLSENTGNNGTAIRALVAQGVDVNATDTAGDTALHLATRAKAYDNLEALLNAGADPLIKNDAAQTAMDCTEPDDVGTRMFLQGHAAPFREKHETLAHQAAAAAQRQLEIQAAAREMTTGTTNDVAPVPRVQFKPKPPSA